MEQVIEILHPNGERLVRRGFLNLKLPEYKRFLEVMGSEYDHSTLYWVEYYRSAEVAVTNIAFAIQSKLERNPRHFRVGSLHHFPVSTQDPSSGYQLFVTGETNLKPIPIGLSISETLLKAMEIANSVESRMWMFRTGDVVKNLNEGPFFLRDWIIANSHVSRLLAVENVVFSQIGDGGVHPVLTDQAAFNYVVREQMLSRFFALDPTWLATRAGDDEKKLISAICYRHSEYVKTGQIDDLDKLLKLFADLNLESRV